MKENIAIKINASQRANEFKSTPLETAVRSWSAISCVAIGIPASGLFALGDDAPPNGWLLHWADCTSLIGSQPGTFGLNVERPSHPAKHNIFFFNSSPKQTICERLIGKVAMRSLHNSSRRKFITVSVSKEKNTFNIANCVLRILRRRTVSILLIWWFKREVPIIHDTLASSCQKTVQITHNRVFFYSPTRPSSFRFF